MSSLPHAHLVCHTFYTNILCTHVQDREEGKVGFQVLKAAGIKTVSGLLCCVVWQKSTNISEVSAASIAALMRAAANTNDTSLTATRLQSTKMQRTVSHLQDVNR
jgi:hypothetical protein